MPDLLLQVNVTFDCLENIMDSTSGILDTSRTALHTADASGQSISDRLPALVEELAKEVGKTLDDDQLLQIVRTNIVLTVVTKDINSNEDTEWPISNVPVAAEGLQYCHQRDGRWICDDRRTGARPPRPTHTGSFAGTNIKLPPLKYIVDTGVNDNVNISISVTHAAVEFAVYASDKVFSAETEAADGFNDQTVSSPVIVAIVPNTTAGSVFRNGAKMSYTVKHAESEGFDVRSRTCRWYVAFDKSWSNAGCSVAHGKSNENSTTCECEHLTSFAVLMDLSADDSMASTHIDSGHQQALSGITYVGVGTSIVCLVLTIVTFLTFNEAINLSKTIQLHLAGTMAASLVLFLIATVGLTAEEATWCKTARTLLHYSLLSTFCWCAVQANHLYRTFVVVFDSATDEKLRLRLFAAFAYGVPAIIAGLTAWLVDDDAVTSCWLSGDAIWAFAGPVLLVIAGNLFVFAKIMAVICTVKENSSVSRFRKLKRNLKATLSFFSLLGVTWIFGLLSLIESEDGTLVYQYAFSILNAFTGVLMFVFHCWLDPGLREELAKYRRRRNKRQDVSRFNRGTGSSHASRRRHRHDSSNWNSHSASDGSHSTSVHGSRRSDTGDAHGFHHGGSRHQSQHKAFSQATTWRQQIKDKLDLSNQDTDGPHRSASVDSGVAAFQRSSSWRPGGAGEFAPPAPHSVYPTANWDRSDGKDLEVGLHQLDMGMDEWVSQSSDRRRFWSMGSLPQWTEPNASDNEEEDAAFVDSQMHPDIPNLQCIKTEPVHFWQVERRYSVLSDGTLGPDVQQWVLHHDVNLELTDGDASATQKTKLFPPPPEACNAYEDGADCLMVATPACTCAAAPIAPVGHALGPTLTPRRVHVEQATVVFPSSPIQADAVAAASEIALSPTLMSEEEEQATHTAAPLQCLDRTGDCNHTDSDISDLLAGAAPFQSSAVGGYGTYEVDLDDDGAFALTTTAIFRAAGNSSIAGGAPPRRSSTFPQLIPLWTEDQPIEGKQLSDRTTL